MLDIKAFEPFPALQLAVAFVVALAGVCAIYFGLRAGRKAGAAPATDPAILFFDGPIGGCLKALERIGLALEHAPILQAELRAAVQDIGERVSEGKRALFDRIDEVEQREAAHRRDLDSRLRAVEQECARLGVTRRR